jgi:PAS domain S-box-containing protein
MPIHEERKPIILSADDDENAQFLLRRAFDKAGVRASLKEARDGTDVLQYLAGEGAYRDRAQNPWPDLLLLDLKMPRITGFGVLEFIRKNPSLQTFPVVVFSSSDHAEDVRKAYELGCQSYVVKPVEFQKLVDLVRALGTEFLHVRAASGAPTPPNLSRFVAPPPAHAAATTPPSPPGLVTNNTQENRPAPPAVEKPPTPAPMPAETYRVLVEQVKDYAIFMLDRDGHVMSWNEGARRMKGYEPHEIIGRHFSTFYPKGDLESEKPAFELRLAIEMGRYEEEGWRMRKDGSRFWANVVITPLRAPDGSLAGFAKVTRDLTQRKLQEEHLQRLLESEEKFRLLVEQVKDYAIFILDAKGNVNSWNQGARRLKGYSSDEIIGRHFSTFYTAEDLATDKPSRELAIAIREGRYEEEGWRIRKDRTRFWANVVITSLWDKRGNLTGFAKVTRDLTQRKREEESLRRKTDELEAFAHTLSHDLRAPLRSVISFAEILRKDRKDLSTEDQTVYLEKILSAAKSMDTLMTEILRLSQLSLAPAPDDTVPLDDVIDEAVRMLESEVESVGATIAIHKPLPAIYANRTLLLQIFSNLIGNALKFARHGEAPKIEVFHQIEGSRCEIHVRDQGIGIAPDDQNRIFKIFDRGGADESFQGTGVGLAIVKKAAERIGANVMVHSAEGEGSDFVVTLPPELVAVPMPATNAQSVH